jgi:hypothetical protein
MIARYRLFIAFPLLFLGTGCPAEGKFVPCTVDDPCLVRYEWGTAEAAGVILVQDGTCSAPADAGSSAACAAATCCAEASACAQEDAGTGCASLASCHAASCGEEAAIPDDAGTDDAGDGGSR